MSKRGKIKDYTKGTEQRLVAQLRKFFADVAGRRLVFVTLTTKERDPSLAKALRMGWESAVRYRSEVQGVYCVEFNAQQMVHYHYVLALAGELALQPSAVVAKELWDAWRMQGDFDFRAFSLKPVSYPCRDWVIRYMAKSDDENGNAHRERWQKALPAAFRDRGLACHWWGTVGLRNSIERPPASLPQAA